MKKIVLGLGLLLCTVITPCYADLSDKDVNTMIRLTNHLHNHWTDRNEQEWAMSEVIKTTTRPNVDNSQIRALFAHQLLMAGKRSKAFNVIDQAYTLYPDSDMIMTVFIECLMSQL